MRSTILICLALFTFACGDDSGGGGAGGDSSSSKAAGDGGAGPTTTGAGGIADDGTEATIDACNAASATSTAVSDELGCELATDPEYCADNAPTWPPCVGEWNAYFVCIDGAATVEACTCAPGGLECGFETSCGDELDALTACAG